MASSANTFSDTLNANFKVVYAEKINDLIPDGTKLVQKIPFSGREAMMGQLFSQPVVLGLEWGITYASATDDAFALNAPVSGQLKEAQVRGCSMVLRSVLGYVAAARAAGGGQRAFEDATKYLIENMMKSMSKALEVQLLYGQMGLATVASIAANVITITTGEWAPGIWCGAVNKPLEIRTAAGALRGYCSVSAVDLSARTISVDLAPAGVIGTDVIYSKGSYGNEMAGIHKILTNTGSLFGIDAGVYSDLWKASTVSAGSAALTFAKLQDAIALGVEKGLDGDVMVLVNPKTWADLLTEQAALRQYDASYKSSLAENGAQEIAFHSQAGKASIVPSVYVKESYAYVLSIEDFSRIGSHDISFNRPGQEGKYFRDLENNHGFEVRASTDQAVFCSAPGKSVLITGITN
jgi:hypothetical protein